MTSRLALLVLPLVVLATVAPDRSAQAQDAYTPGFRAAVKSLLEEQNAAPMIGEQMSWEMAMQMLQAIANTGVPVTEPMQQIVLDAAREEYAATFGDLEFLTDLYVPAYARHFEEKEVRELAAFWSSPLGRKTLEVMPTLTQEANATLQTRGFERLPAFQQRVDARLRAAGIVVPGAPGAENAPDSPEAPGAPKLLAE